MVGKRIANYEITDKLGEGGMGVVHRATDTKLNREVAIKVLPPLPSPVTAAAWSAFAGKRSSSRN